MSAPRSVRRRENVARALELAGTPRTPLAVLQALDARIREEPLIPNPNRESRRARIRSTWPRTARRTLANFGAWRRRTHTDR